MDTVNIGKSDLKVSRIGLGCAQFGTEGIGVTDPEECKRLLNHALDSGINYLDTAESYGKGLSEKVVGEVLKERGEREDVVLATKVHPFHMGFDEVLKAGYASLRRMQLDRIDLLQVHSPDPAVPISETMIAMKHLVQDGQVRYVGLSNFPVCLTEVAFASLEGGEIISNQMRYNLLARGIEKALLTHTKWRGMSLIAYSPLAQGMLTRRYGEEGELPDDSRATKPLFANRGNVQVLGPLFEAMNELGERYGASAAGIALNWLLRDEAVIPIPGVTTTAQMDELVHATTFRLSDDEWNRLAGISDDLRVDRFYNFGGA